MMRDVWPYINRPVRVFSLLVFCIWICTVVLHYSLSVFRAEYSPGCIYTIFFLYAGLLLLFLWIFYGKPVLVDFRRKYEVYVDWWHLSAPVLILLAIIWILFMDKFILHPQEDELSLLMWVSPFFLVVMGFQVFMLVTRLSPYIQEIRFQEWQPDFNAPVANDKVIRVTGRSSSDLTSLLSVYCQAVNENQERIRTRVESLGEDVYLIYFPYDIPLSIYCELLYNLIYTDPMIFQYQVRGWGSFPAERKMKELGRVMFFVPEDNPELIYFVTDQQVTYQLRPPRLTPWWVEFDQKYEPLSE